MKRFAVVVMMLLACASLSAQMPPRPPRSPQAPQDVPRPPIPPEPPADPIARELFPPELIMGHQEELQLLDKQRTAIRAELVNLQTKVVDLQWQLSEQAERMAGLLKAIPIDEAKVLEQSDKVMSLEREIKRLHLGTLIRIKNSLTADQIGKLQEMRRPRR